LKIEHLSVNIKLPFYKALLKSIMTCDCIAWEFVADGHLFKLQRLQKKVLCAIDNLPRHTRTRDLHVAFRIPYLYDFVRKLFKQQATVTLKHESIHFSNIDQREAQHRQYKRLKLGGR